MFAIGQFFVAVLLAAVCAKVIGVSGGDIPLIALLVPVLWLFKQRSFAYGVFFVSVLGYGMTLAHQHVALSVSVWILFPLLMVLFSKRSNRFAVAIAVLIVITLQVSIIATQNSGKLAGSATMTVVQTISIVLMWWSVSNWKPNPHHRWWALALIVPLWLAQFTYGIVFALGALGIVLSLESLLKVKDFDWGSLACWTLPTVGFTALILNPQIDVPKSVLFVWLCLLATAWVTDYILQSLEYNEET